MCVLGGGGGGGGGCWLSKACEFLVACQIYIDVMCFPRNTVTEVASGNFKLMIIIMSMGNAL